MRGTYTLLSMLFGHLATVVAALDALTSILAESKAVHCFAGACTWIC